MSANVLLVEDNDENRHLATFLLTRAGHTVVHAGDGLAALALAERQVPDLILMDVQLPLLDGYETTERMRAIPSLARVPIIAVTSYASPGDRARARAIGFTDYLEKPIDPTTFVSVVEKYLKEHP